MTDQTPPPGQPSSLPGEGLGPGDGTATEHGDGPGAEPGTSAEHGVGTGAEHGAATGAEPTDSAATPPPPLAPTHEGASGFEPAPAAKRSRKGLIIGLIAGLVALALIAAVVVVVLMNTGDDKHSITIPSKAAGMKRDNAKETELKPQLTPAEKQFKTQFKSVTYVKSGVYTQDDTKRGPKGDLVFLGAKVKSSEKNAATFVSRFEKQATTNGFKIDKIAPGDNGGKAVCAYQTAQKVAVCAWATKDSGGELVPLVPGYDSKKLSKIMIALRSDVEKTE